MADIIHDLELSVRATNVLTAYGHVKTLDDFMALTEAQVMRMPRAGRVTWKEIKSIQASLRGRESSARPTASDSGAVFVPPSLPERMFNETRRHMQRMEFCQGRQAAALETLAEAQIAAEPAMSLRDAAALAALQGMTASSYGGGSPAGLAKRVWEIADSFIAARGAKTE
jgi:hypothetical protein